MNESFNVLDLLDPKSVLSWTRTDTAASAHSLHLHLCSAAAHALKSIAVSLASHDCKIASDQFILRAFCRRSRASLHYNQSISLDRFVLLIRREENHCIQLIYSTLLI